MSTASYPESPCVGLCQMDGQRRYCMGCGRTLNEIATWSRMSVDEKRAVLERVGDSGSGRDAHKAE
ncbi:DUF1289 domain-containing protein [Aquisalimonas asiatica]|uniref:DUF1289 domain-containing protein n=1 Tax=Aquisalimonas asiatica TaxID=406100 RepID=A0A1H8TXY2_9GAMM|nr:DUF1289 domain-containing protein [Aquisalimonas asiatica]SEO95705.1 hypothetical protein SAMN04488052_10511 [Aquisalimonas asiatica]